MTNKIILIMIISILMNTSLIVSAEENKYEIIETDPILSQYNDEKNRNDDSDYVNQMKVEAQSGLQQVFFPTMNCQNYTKIKIDTNGNITSSRCVENLSHASFNVGGNELILKDGEIISASSGLIATVGGYNHIGMMYPTVADAYNETNGVTISGGGFDGAYYQTYFYNNQYFYEVQIAGYHGYMKSEEATIIPVELIQSQSHYQNINDELVYFAAVNVFEPNSYEKMILGPAPESMKENTKYYSYDDINFYTTPLTDTTVINHSALNNYTYWQWLPARSTSAYTATNYKSYLASIGKTNSEYYNDTNGFVKAEDTYNINSTILFSMANLESAYGTSNFARKCHNFFGWGAYDANPSNACDTSKGGYDFAKNDQVDDAIMAHANNVSNGYADIYDWRYHGTHLGNKTTGMNVKYASDPDWGKKISSLAYNFDRYDSRVETGYFKLGKTKTQSTTIYKTASGSESFVVTNGNSSTNAGSAKTYLLKRGGVGNSSTNYSEIPVVIVGESGSRYRVQMDTAINNGGDTCAWVNANYGYHPNYSGLKTTSVAGGRANFSCDYAWPNEKGYINKSAVTVINNVPAREVGTAYDFVNLKEPFVVRTKADNTTLFYGTNIRQGSTMLVATSTILYNDEIVGYEVITNPQTNAKDYIMIDQLNYSNAKVWEIQSGVNIRQNPTTSSSIILTTNKVTYLPRNATVTGNSVSGNNQWTQVEVNPLNSQFAFVSNTVSNNSFNAPSLNATVEKIYLKNDQLYAEGVGFINYVNIPTTADTDVYLNLKTTNGQYSQEYKMCETQNANLMNTYKKSHGYDYKYGYYKNCNSQPIDLKSLPAGNYQIFVKVNSRGIIKEQRMYSKSASKILNIFTYGGSEYTLKVSNNSVYLNKKNLVNPTNPVAHTTLESGKLNKDQLSVEGISFIDYVSAPTSSNNKVWINVKPTVANTNNYYKMCAAKNTAKTNNYAKQQNTNYDYGYYKNCNGSTVNLNSLQPGNYQLFIKIESSSFIKEQRMFMSGNNRVIATSEYNGYKYTLKVSNNSVYLTKTIVYDVNNIQGRMVLENINVSSGKLTAEGIGILGYIPSDTTENTDIWLSLKNSAGNEVSKIKVCETTNSQTANYEKQFKTNYKYGYFKMCNGKSLDLTNLPNGNYQVFLTVKSYEKNKEQRLTSAKSNQVLHEVNYNGKTYQAKVSNNSIYITIK